MPVEKNLSDVSDGAVLAVDVFDGRGDVLLAKGTKLTSAHLQLLDRRGIASVTLEVPGEAGVVPGGVNAAQVAEWLARQERVFSKVRQDPRMEVIYQAARLHLASGNLPPT